MVLKLMKGGYYQSEDLEYEISHGESTITVKLRTEIYPVGYNKSDDKYYFKYGVIEKNYGTETRRIIECNAKTTVQEQVNLIIADIAKNANLIVKMLGISTNG